MEVKSGSYVSAKQFTMTKSETRILATYTSFNHISSHQKNTLENCGGLTKDQVCIVV